MVASPKELYLTPEDYLEAEKVSQIKHEYVRGELRAMSGASDAHVTIAFNVGLILKGHLRGSNCRFSGMDMKVRIEALNTFYYPDLLVTCDPRDRAFDYYQCYPKLIIEILSPSTETCDRGDKFADYRELPSLEEYVLVSQKQQQVECFRRNGEGQWVLSVYRAGEEVELASVGLRCAIADFYEDII